MKETIKKIFQTSIEAIPHSLSSDFVAYLTQFFKATEKEVIDLIDKCEILFYVIKNDTGSKFDQYLGIAEFGSIWYSGLIKNAFQFESYETALQFIMSSPELNESSVMSNGTIYPPRGISKALDLNNDKLSGSGSLSIVPIMAGPAISTHEISGEIKQPKAYVY